MQKSGPAKHAKAERKGEESSAIRVFSGFRGRIRIGREEGGPKGLEFLGDDFLDGGEVEVVAELGVEGGDGALGGGDAAGDDAGEVGEVGVYVEGEAVVSDPAADGDTEGGDFARADPNAGEAGAAGGDEAEGTDGVDEDLFEEAEVGVEVFAGGEGDDRIADELAGAVVGDIAATVGFRDLDALGGETGGVPDEVSFRAGAKADGEDGVMLGEDEGIADFAGEVLRDESLLGRAGGLVARAAPVDDRARAWWRDRG